MLGGGGGWQNKPCDAKLSVKCPCSHNNNNALIKQIILFVSWQIPKDSSQTKTFDQ